MLHWPWNAVVSVAVLLAFDGVLLLVLRWAHRPMKTPDLSATPSRAPYFLAPNGWGAGEAITIVPPAWTQVERICPRCRLRVPPGVCPECGYQA